MTDETPKLGDRDQISETLAKWDAAKRAEKDHSVWDMFFCTAMRIVYSDKDIAENSIGCEVAAELADDMMAERAKRIAK